MAEDRTYTETEHTALMSDAVQRMTAALTTDKAALETSVSELTAKVDVLEAEKAALETKVSESEKAFDEFKGKVERDREVAALQTSRTEAVKAANDKLPDTYFTAERVLAWAEMSEDTFAVVLDGISATAGAPSGAGRETAAFSGGESPTEGAKAPLVGKFLAMRQGI